MKITWRLPASLGCIALLVATVTLAILWKDLTTLRYKKGVYTGIYEYQNRGDEAFDLADEEPEFIKITDTEHQKAELTFLSHGILDEHIDEEGHTVLNLDLPRILEPNSSFTVKLSYEVLIKRNTRPLIRREDAGYLKDIPIEFKDPSKMFDCIDFNVDPFRKEIVLNTVLECTEWIHKNIEYEIGDYAKHPQAVIDGGKGDCDDMAGLLVAMLHKLNIPAYIKCGAIVDDGIIYNYFSYEGHARTDMKGVVHHGYACAYIPPWGWTAIDPSHWKFGTDAVNKIENTVEYGTRFIEFETAYDMEKYSEQDETFLEKILASDIYFTNNITFTSNKFGNDWLLEIAYVLGLISAWTLLILFIVKKYKSNNAAKRSSTP